MPPLRALGLAPGDCLFVDDSPDLVEAAIALGYHGRAVLRHGEPDGGVPSITALDQILHLVTTAAAAGELPQ